MSYVDEVINKITKENPGEPEFHQTLNEVYKSIEVAVEENEEQYKKTQQSRQKKHRTHASLFDLLRRLLARCYRSKVARAFPCGRSGLGYGRYFCC